MAEYLTDAELAQAKDMLNRITMIYQAKVVGQEDLRTALTACLLAGGHVLVESVPGLAKTTAAQTLASAVSGTFHRIQCTPDLMPNDIVGSQIWNQASGEMVTQLGPVHANLVLMDEINRSSAKTQSAMLEAMQEGQTTIGGVNHRLPRPFMVMATQNPIEQEGTYPLPEAQVDRFMLKVVVNYPKKEEEQQIIRQNLEWEREAIKPVISTSEIIEARKLVKSVYMDEKIERYIVDIVFATRFPEEFGLKKLKGMISYGASPRASINMALAAKAYAFIKRRGYVIPEDIRAVAHDVLRHRIGLSYEAEANSMTSEEIINDILNAIEVP